MTLLYSGVYLVHAHSDDIFENHHMMSYNTGYGLIGYASMFIFTILIVGLVIYLIIYSTSQKKDEQKNSGDTVLSILNERYAKGEIDKFEFEQKKKDLQ